MKCKLCGSEFTPEEGQKEAYWAINWCASDNGLLCPPCHEAAEKLGAISDSPLPIGVCPFGSDIAKGSSTVSERDWEKHRKSESWRNWVETNHPEWI